MTTLTDAAAIERVVLLAEDGTVCGAQDKATVHHADTPLHLAFSTYLFNPEGQVLLTRRALTKVAWPGVWTNSACGHPAPGELVTAAAQRRVRQELGLTISDLTPILPDFRYRAVDDSGVVENEICPVFSAPVVAEVVPRANPDEVLAVAWVDWAGLVATALTAPALLSPWSVAQVTQLHEQGWQPPVLGCGQG